MEMPRVGEVRRLEGRLPVRVLLRRDDGLCFCCDLTSGASVWLPASLLEPLAPVEAAPLGPEVVEFEGRRYRLSEKARKVWRAFTEGVPPRKGLRARLAAITRLAREERR